MITNREREREEMLCMGILKIEIGDIVKKRRGA